jgi:hypothetical protein
MGGKMTIDEVRSKRWLRGAVVRRRAFRTLGAVVALLMPAALGARSAFAGTYVMRNCDVPGQHIGPLAPWQRTDPPSNVVLVDDCANGRGVGFRVEGSVGMAGGLEAGLVLAKPAGARSAIRLVKAVLWYAARLAGSGQPINFWAVDYRSDGTVPLGLSNAPPGSENLVAEQQLSPITHTVGLGIHCGPLGGVQTHDPCVPFNTTPLLLRGIEVTLSEDVQPMVSPPGGTLLTAGRQSGTRTLTYVASDPQSGLAKVDVLLDDTVVASRDMGSRCTYSDFTACPESDTDTMAIDTRAVANGSRRVTLRARDAAGNQRVVDVGSIEIANDPPAGSNLAPAYMISVGFRGSSQSTLTANYGRRVVIQGRLAGGLPSGPNGAQLDVLERLAHSGAREVVAGHVRANADGTFAYVLPTTHASRTVRLAYRSSEVSVASQVLRLRVRAASSLHASLRGLVVHFGGRVRSGPIPKGGKRVRMEGRSPGSAWTSFATLRTRRSGAFSGTYRLRIRRPGVRLKIRAVVPAEDGYGYLTSRGQAVTLRVR